MIRAAILRWARSRQPDFVIGGMERPYLLRWWLIPRNPVFNIYVHQFLRSDDDRALHDHPWLFNCSILLEGQYREWVRQPGDEQDTPIERSAGQVKFRWGGSPHRVELLTVADFVATQPTNSTPIPCWTVFITGPRVRQWGFHCPNGWVHWKDFTAPSDKGAVGRGCDE